jgi:hydrogenase 3 maturation protease
LSREEYSIQEELKKWLSGAKRVVVAGIGNPIRMDDFVGVKIVQDLREKVSDKVLLIECETVPESSIQEIVDFKPTHVLLIDSAILDLKPGKARLTDCEQLTNFQSISTHDLPLRIFCEYVSKMTGARIVLLLIVPEKTDFGEGLSTEVKAAAENIVRVLTKNLP